MGMGIYLDKPDLIKKGKNGFNDTLAYSTCSMQGWRTTMEDNEFAILDLAPDLSMFGVFDGHGGFPLQPFLFNNS